jgi:TonB family protein
METVALPPADAELHLLTDWGDADAAARRKKAVVGTVLVHVAVIAFLISVPPMVVEPEKAVPTPHITILEPLTELTQKTPNKGKITKEFESKLQVPRAAVQAPVAPPAIQPKPQAPRPAVIPQAPAPKAPAAVPSLPEPPKLDTSVKEQPKPDLPAVAQTAPSAPPQIQTVEKPKLTLENVPPAAPPPQAHIPVPSSSVNDAIRELAHGQGNTMVIGDPGASASGYGGITQTPAPGTPLANVELKFDPQGVDFRPYVTQILATVKRNWMAVMPQSVKLGRRGKVALQFSIRRDGTVDKLVYAQNSGADALDKAAVSAISASNPFPPLPGQFKGDRIVLQLNFVYR